MAQPLEKIGPYAYAKDFAAFKIIRIIWCPT